MLTANLASPVKIICGLRRRHLVILRHVGKKIDILASRVLPVKIPKRIVSEFRIEAEIGRPRYDPHLLDKARRRTKLPRFRFFPDFPLAARRNFEFRLRLSGIHPHRNGLGDRCARGHCLFWRDATAACRRYPKSYRYFRRAATCPRPLSHRFSMLSSIIFVFK